MIRIILTLILFHRFCGAANVEWILNLKLKTIENSLLYKRNLSKFLNVSHGDNNIFMNDENKEKRSYDNARCITNLQWIQNNIDDVKNTWPYECKTYHLHAYWTVTKNRKG